MYEDFFAIRMAKLRELKNVSAREMSLAIGQNKNYINQIENRKTYPTMKLFFVICDYFNITPNEFFSGDNNYPEQLNTLIEKLKKLDVKVLTHIEGMADEIISSKNSK